MFVNIVREELRPIMAAIAVLSSILVLVVLVLIDRTVNQTLYNFGLQLSSQWALPYQIYFDLGLALLIVNAVAASLLGLTFRFEKSKRTENNSLQEGEESVLTPEALTVAQMPEENKEIKLQSSENVPLKKELSVVRYCRYCSSENEPDAVFCEKCGKNILAKNKNIALARLLFCRACGAKNKVSAVYCKNCGLLLN